LNGIFALFATHIILFLPLLICTPEGKTMLPEQLVEGPEIPKHITLVVTEFIAQ
jgi:hypothetical protein